jgi:hypothetical protein
MVLDRPARDIRPPHVAARRSFEVDAGDRRSNLQAFKRGSERCTPRLDLDGGLPLNLPLGKEETRWRAPFGGENQGLPSLQGEAEGE